MKLNGTAMLFDEPMPSSRIYTRRVVSKAVEEKKDKIAMRAMLGGFGEQPEARVKLSEASHLVTNVLVLRDSLYVEIETVDTEKGRELEGLVKAGIKLNFMTAGYGSLAETSEPDAKEKIYTVRDDYTFITINVVEFRDHRFVVEQDRTEFLHQKLEEVKNL